MGEGADRDEVDPGLGVGPDGAERDAAGCLELGAAGGLTTDEVTDVDLEDTPETGDDSDVKDDSDIDESVDDEPPGTDAARAPGPDSGSDAGGDRRGARTSDGKQTENGGAGS